MKRLTLLYLVLLTIGLAACAAPSTGGTPTPAASPTASPLSTPTPDTPPSSPTSAPSVPSPTASPIAEASGLLPAPLYYLAVPDNAADQPAQLWRLEADGATITRISDEAAGVQFFDLSPVDNSLAYVSGLDLIRTDALGANRTVLYTMREGQAGVHPDVPAALIFPRWSPDGTRIAFGLNGINLIAAAGGSAPEVIMPSTYEPNNYEGTRFYMPHSWSPDGSRLLVSYAYYPEGSNLALLEVSSGTLTEIAFEAGMPCCDPVWAPDGSAIYLAAAATAFTDPGLWRIDAATGAVETLIQGDRQAQELPAVVVGQVHPTPDGLLYAWRYPVLPGSPPETLFSLTPELARVNPAQAADPAAWEVVSPAHLNPAEVRWFPDGRGLVTAFFDPALSEQPLMAWVPTDGSSLIPLPVVGSHLRWGQP